MQTEIVTFVCRRCGHLTLTREDKGIRIKDGRIVLPCELCAASNVLPAPKPEREPALVSSR